MKSFSCEIRKKDLKEKKFTAVNLEILWMHAFLHLTWSLLFTSSIEKEELLKYCQMPKAKRLILAHGYVKSQIHFS